MMSTGSPPYPQIIFPRHHHLLDLIAFARAFGENDMNKFPRLPWFSPMGESISGELPFGKVKSNGSSCNVASFI